MKVKMYSALATLVVAGLLISITSPYGQPLGQKSKEGRLIMAEVEMTPHGVFGATLNSESSVYGSRPHTSDDATFSHRFAETFVMKAGETLTIYLTAAAVIQSHRRTLTCRIKDEGKTVRSDQITVRAHEPGKAIACDLTVYN